MDIEHNSPSIRHPGAARLSGAPARRARRQRLRALRGAARYRGAADAMGMMRMGWGSMCGIYIYIYTHTHIYI